MVNLFLIGVRASISELLYMYTRSEKTNDRYLESVSHYQIKKLQKSKGKVREGRMTSEVNEESEMSVRTHVYYTRMRKHKNKTEVLLKISTHYF